MTNPYKVSSCAMIVVLAAFWCVYGASGQVSPRQWYTTNTLNAGIEQDALRAFSAEDWRMDLWTVTDAGAYSLATNTTPVWYITARTNPATVYSVTTGTLVVATAGHVRVSVGWTNTILAAGRYIGYVRAYQAVGGVNQYIGTLAAHYIDVTASPDAGSYALQAPVAFGYLVSSNQMGSGFEFNSALGQWEATATVNAGATNAFGTGRLSLGYNRNWKAVTGTVDVTGLATGTPLYAYTETDPIWSATNSWYSRTNHTHGQYATGTPLYAYAETDPVWSVEKSGYATGTPLYAETYLGTITGATITAGTADSVTVTGPNASFIWDTNKAAISSDGGATGVVLTASITNFSYDADTREFTIHAAAGGSGGMDPAIASNSFVVKDGDTMTGALSIGPRTNCLRLASAHGTSGGVGISAQGAGAMYTLYITNVDSIAIGDANGTPSGNSVAIGKAANAATGVAIGDTANGVNGVGVGVSANGNTTGVGVGGSANGSGNGASVGASALGYTRGAALGYTAKGLTESVGVGYLANAQSSNIAIGAYANSGVGGNRISFGWGITNNDINNSARIRGSLYLDGATQLVFRSTFGSGDWSVGLQTETGRLYSINSEGTRTLISPHAPDGQAILLSENPYVGEQTIIHLERVAAALESMGHTGMIERIPIPKRDWDAEQSARAAARLVEIADWDKARMDAIKAANAWDASPVKDQEGQVRPDIPALSDRPQPYTPIPAPDWFKSKKGDDKDKP